MAKRKSEAGEGEPESKKHAGEPVEETSTNSVDVLLRFLVPVGTAARVEANLDEIKAESGAEIVVESIIPGAVERIVTSRGPRTSQRAAAAHVISASGFLPIESKGEPEDTKPAPKKRGGRKKKDEVKEETNDETKSEQSPRGAHSLSVILAEAVIVSKAPDAITGDPTDSWLQDIKAKADEPASDLTIELSRSLLPMSADRSLLFTCSSAEPILKAIDLLVDELSESNVELLEPTVAYTPQSVIGVYGHPDGFRRQALNEAIASQNAYIDPSAALPSGPASMREPAPAQNHGNGHGLGPGDPMRLDQPQAGPNGQLTQQIFVPNDQVGMIIGKGGATISEIRQVSGSLIKIDENPADPSSPERSIIITGTPEANKIALSMLYQRLDSERRYHKK